MVRKAEIFESDSLTSLKKIFSSGAVVYKIFRNKVKIVLIAKNKKQIWCLPKGKIEKGETREQAAIREVSEETGIQTIQLKRYLGKISYNYYISDIRQPKTVHFFLAKYIKGRLYTTDIEIDDTKWFFLSDAIAQMSYSSEIKIVKKAKLILKQHRLCEKNKP